jgi:ribosomal protein S18 acetylase RimI-like enzyme
LISLAAGTKKLRIIIWTDRNLFRSAHEHHGSFCSLHDKVSAVIPRPELTMKSQQSAKMPEIKWEHQPFDSEWMGRPVGRLSIPQECDKEELRQELSRMRQNWAEESVWLLSCRIPEGQHEVGNVLEEFDFQPIESLVTFSRPLQGNISDASSKIGTVDLATLGDVEECVEIGRQAFVFDRYHADPRIDNAKASELKAVWVRNSLSGRSDASFVFRSNGNIKGFVLCLLDNDMAAIDLIAVKKSARGKGVGRSLVAGAINYYIGRAPLMRVGTQANNFSSTALYKSMGFLELIRHTTYHYMEVEANK